MKLYNFTFCDSQDDTETEVRCESFDAALQLFCSRFDVFFVVEKVEEGTTDDLGFPVIFIEGYSTLDKG